MTVLTSNEITITIFALFSLLLSSFIFGKLFEKIRMPRVVGEIFGGMVIGGSFIALIFPDFFNAIFNGYKNEGKVLNIFYQLGLIFLMFSSGFNTSININKKTIKNHLLLFFGATVIPMILAIPFVGIFEKSFIGTVDNHVSFLFVFLISVAITSIPVISKIFFDIGMMNTKFSNMVLTVSTLQDLCLWILLNLSITTAQNGSFDLITFITTILLTIGLLAVAKLIDYIARRTNFKIKSNAMPLAFVILFLIVYLLSKININIMYSSFIGGYILKAVMQDKKEDMDKIKDFSFAFFIPVYFALVGIQLDVINNFSVSRFVLYFLIAFGLEFVGTFFTMLFSKLKKKTITSLAITMNARGGPGIVLATTAYSANIINIEFFTVLIITTMLSSAIAGYWLRVFKNDIQNDG